MMMKIGEVADRSGLNTSTLRYYEEIGLLEMPKRINGQRAYDKSVLTRLKFIKRLRVLDFSLTEIKELLDTDVSRTGLSGWKTAATQKINEVEAQIAHFTQLKSQLEDGLTCECNDLATCTLFQ